MGIPQFLYLRSCKLQEIRPLVADQMADNEVAVDGKCSWPASAKAVVSMVVVQCFATGLQLLSRVVLDNGTFVFALMTYRHIVAAVCVAPFAFILERGKKEIKLSLRIWLWLSINALSGITAATSLYYYGLKYTTATYAVNFLNLIPIVTFILSVILRMETLRLHTWAGQVKTIGTIICVAGALTTSIYTGKKFYINHKYDHPDRFIIRGAKNISMKGSIMLSCSCICFAVWYLVQVKLLKMFPLKYWTTLLTCLIASAQSGVIGLCFNRSMAAWRIALDLQLLTIIYSGALASAATFCLVSWAVSNRGPTYPPMFNPLTLVFVAGLEAFTLGEPIKLGMVLGTVLIVSGLYSYLWGKQREVKMTPLDNQVTSENIVIETIRVHCDASDRVHDEPIQTRKIETFH